MEVSNHRGPPDISKSGFILLLFVTVLACVALNVALLNRGVFAVSADSSARVLDAYEWMKDPVPRALVWPPLFRVVVGGALMIWPDLVITPRVVVFIFGVGTVLAVAWLAMEFFGSRRVGAVSALLAAILPERVILSLVPLVGVLYILPVVLGLVFLWRWLDRRRPANAIGAALCFALASSARYEGWFFSLAAVCVVWWAALAKPSTPRREWWLAVAFAVICAAFPVYWLGLHLLEHGNLDWITKASGSRFELRFGDSFGMLLPRTAPVQFLLGSLASLEILGLVSLVKQFRKRPQLRLWLLVPGLAFAIVSILALAGEAVPSHNFWRISAVWCVLLVPFFAHWLVRILDSARKRGRWIGVAATTVAALLVTGACTWRIVKLTAKPSFGVQELRMARELDRVLTEADPSPWVLIDTSTMRYFHVCVGSQHPDSFVLNTGRDPRRPTASGLVDPLVGTVDLEGIREGGISYLVFRRTKLVKALEEHPELEQMARFGLWRLFRVLGPEKGRPLKK